MTNPEETRMTDTIETPKIPELAPVRLAVQATDGSAVDREILGEATTNPYLAIVPVLGPDGLTGSFALIHAPSGRAVMADRPHVLRGLAAKVADLDWSGPAEELPAATLTAAKDAIRAVRITQPDSVEMPAHDAWGPDGKGKGMKRAAVPMAIDMLADQQLRYNNTNSQHPDGLPMDVPDPGSERGTKINPAWLYACLQACNDFGLAYLLLALHRVDPVVADSAAAFLSDALDEGETVGEFGHEWAQALANGETPNLPGIPRHGDLLDAAPVREINTPQVRQAISAAIHNEVPGSYANQAAGAVYRILDLASAGRLRPCEVCFTHMDGEHEVGARAGDVEACGACADSAEPAS